MYDIIQQFSALSVSPLGSETPAGRRGVPRPGYGLVLCLVSSLMRIGPEPHCSSPGLTVFGQTFCWDESTVGGEERQAVGVVTHLTTWDEGRSGRRERHKRGQRHGTGQEPLWSDQSVTSIGFLQGEGGWRVDRVRCVKVPSRRGQAGDRKCEARVMSGNTEVVQDATW